MTIRKLRESRTVTSNEYSEKALKRLKKLEKYDVLIADGCRKSIALSTIELSRATHTRWKKRYRIEGLRGLEDDSRRPTNVRKPEWTAEMRIRVHNLRKLYPVWGKDKIAKHYNDTYHEKISASMTGKILNNLLNDYKIRSVNDVCGKKSPKKSRIFDDHAQRLSKGQKSDNMGVLVQVDHMTVRVPGIGIAKHFNAICPITKIVVAQTYWQATSHNAQDFLKNIVNKMPFPIKSVQVDGGSEFMGDFEFACKTMKIPLFVLPPYSPKLNGGVERVNGTFRYEFYALHERFKSHFDFHNKVQEFTNFYNSVRPHKSLGLLAPCQYLERLN